jgi:hypothetical protein
MYTLFIFPMSTTCLDQLTLDFINLIFGEEHKL